MLAREAPVIDPTDPNAFANPYPYRTQNRRPRPVARKRGAAAFQANFLNGCSNDISDRRLETALASKRRVIFPRPRSCQNLRLGHGRCLLWSFLMTCPEQRGMRPSSCYMIPMCIHAPLHVDLHTLYTAGRRVKQERLEISTLKSSISINSGFHNLASTIV